MRARTMAIGLIQAALLMACEDRSKSDSKLARDRGEVASNKAASPVALGVMGEPAVSQREASGPASTPDQWSRAVAFDPASRLIVRTGQASIEVDSLESSMAELRRIVQRTGGFVADASVQSGKNQLRSATLELKVPSSRFDELTQGLEPLGRLQFVNVGAEDVSEEFVDLTARVANGHRLEDRLVELLRTRTGKLQDVLSVERELARVREEIERMEGRMRFLKTSAQLSTLSVNLYEPAPIVASHPGRSIIGEAFKTAWRNFVGVLAGTIASLGFVVPIVILGWGALIAGKRYKRRTA
jgi:acetolactate synthase regulatory subunit